VNAKPSSIIRAIGQFHTDKTLKSSSGCHDIFRDKTWLILTKMASDVSHDCDEEISRYRHRMSHFNCCKISPSAKTFACWDGLLFVINFTRDLTTSDSQEIAMMKPILENVVVSNFEPHATIIIVDYDPGMNSVEENTKR
jgi:hypothetical protein